MDTGAYMAELGREARAASRLMARSTTQARNTVLHAAAAAIAARRGEIAAANAEDMARAAAQGLDAAGLDRLQLNDVRIDAMV
ncbi:MAG TPA: gamma-glutamyl-phosphate reductase, partial [Pseudomonadales bacterium]|nr:gamma-glutamyl-phosphate reductase [Pseudomonadales bacterium]